MIGDNNPWGMFVENVRRLLREVLPAHEIRLEEPPENLGDVAFPTFNIAKKVGENPVSVAKRVAESLNSKIDGAGWVDRVEQKGPYVNFFVNIKKMAEYTIPLILNLDTAYGHLRPRGKKIVLEHTSANPTDALHVGRARNPIIGDTMARILRAAGYDVETQYYVDDLGKQAVILAYGMHELGYDADSSPYMRASRLYEESEEHRARVDDWLRRLEGGDKEVVEKVRRACLEMMENRILPTLERINVRVDVLAYESQFLEKTREVIENLRPYCGKDNGALYIDLSPYGIEEKVYITRSDGTSLYATRDIAYHLWKLERGDVIINVLGEDHKLESYFVKTAIEKILGIEADIRVLFYSFVTLPEGRMSARKGRVVYFDALLDEAVERARKEVLKRREDMDMSRIDEIARIVGVGAVRFNIVRIQPEKKIVFRWEDALNFEGCSAPFVQYTHARACSILRKGGGYDSAKAPVITHEREIRLIKLLSKYPSVIEYSAEFMAPHKVAQYCVDLATEFNQFYRDCPVIHSEGEVRNTRLMLVDAFRITIRNALDVLGITAPEEM
ncbi:MAG: arginine--tRNA ligase [Thermoplasmata archaeon]|nr:MAG: arginine--tRNA ligase [Thermoplasmata archaeon]